MEKGIHVKDIINDTQVIGIFAVKSAAYGQTRSGAPYWNLIIFDASGTIEAKIWSPLSEEIKEIPSGEYVHIIGHTSKYKEKCQVIISKLHFLDNEQKNYLSLSDFIMTSPYNINEMYKELKAIIVGELPYQPWKQLMIKIFENEEVRESYCKTPAATGVHHAYAGGLLEHSLSVTKLCKSIADLYPELDRQTLLVGAMLHDIGKIREMTGGFTNDYTQEGRLLGHIFLGLEILEPFLAQSELEPWLKEHLRHLILSHHGFPEYGAPRLPQTAEAIALHYADNLDAKLAQCRSLFTPQDDRPIWSTWQKTLDRSILWPKHTPINNLPSINTNLEQDLYPYYQEEEYFILDDMPEPTSEDLAELYADPAFNESKAPPFTPNNINKENSTNVRSNKRDNQCSLL